MSEFEPADRLTAAERALLDAAAEHASDRADALGFDIDAGLREVRNSGPARIGATAPAHIRTPVIEVSQDPWEPSQQPSEHRRKWVRTLQLAAAVMGTISASIATFWVLATHLDRDSGWGGAAKTETTVEASVTCTKLDPLMEGQRVRLRYDVRSSAEVTVDLAVGIYDEAGNDISDGNGNQLGVMLEPGTSTYQLIVQLPVSVGDAARDEVTAEIWPAGKIGNDEVDTVADASCGYITWDGKGK